MAKLLGSGGISVRDKGMSVRSGGMSVRDILLRGKGSFTVGATIRVHEVFRGFKCSRMFKEDTLARFLNWGGSDTSGLLSGLIRTSVVRPMSKCKGKG